MKSRKISFLMILTLSISLVGVPTLNGVTKQQKPAVEFNARKLSFTLGGAVVASVLGIGGFYYFRRAFRKKKNRESFYGTELKEITQSPFQLQTTFKEGDISRLEELLTAGIRLNKDQLLYKDDQNMLHTAINMHPRVAQPAIVKTLLEVMKSEIDINEANGAGASPLFMAIHNIQKAGQNPRYVQQMHTIIGILIEQGADVTKIGPLTRPSTIVSSGTLLDAANKIEDEDVRRDSIAYLKSKGVLEHPLL